MRGFVKLEFDPDSFDVEKIKKLNRDDEYELIKQLELFPEILISAADHREPHRLCDYAKELSAMFHRYYHDCGMVNKRTRETTLARLFLITCIKTVLSKCLDLIGVSVPTKMKKKKDK
jgi:arginyl-tRNA synthetase